MTAQEKEFFKQEAAEIINHPKFLLLKNFIQHGKTTGYDHCLNVAYFSYKKALKKNRKKTKLNLSAIIRGGLLHDFFLYDWHDKNKGFRLHGFKHAKIALNNAIKYFSINDLEKDIIKSHMWPLNILSLPKSKEAWIVLLVDKKLSFKELLFRRRDVYDYIRD